MPRIISRTIPNDLRNGQLEALLSALTTLGFVAGGAARKVLIPDAPEPTDIDVFLYNEKGSTSQADLVLRNMGYSPAPVLPSAYVYRHPAFVLPVQVIKPYVGLKLYGKPAEVLSKFDFTVNQFALEYTAQSLVLAHEGEESHSDHVNRYLNIVNIASPLSLLNRMQKYVAKGYRMPPPEMAKLFLAYGRTPDSYKLDMEDVAEMDNDLALDYAVVEQFMGDDRYDIR